MAHKLSGFSQLLRDGPENAQMRVDIFWRPSMMRVNTAFVPDIIKMYFIGFFSCTVYFVVCSSCRAYLFA
jgi:hypothetical protein